MVWFGERCEETKQCTIFDGSLTPFMHCLNPLNVSSESEVQTVQMFPHVRITALSCGSARCKAYWEVFVLSR